MNFCRLRFFFLVFGIVSITIPAGKMYAQPTNFASGTPGSAQSGVSGGNTPSVSGPRSSLFEPTKTEQTQPIRFRMIYVDPAITGKWLWGNNRYLRIKKETFDQWFERFGRDANLPEKLDSPNSSLQSIVLEARLENQQLVDGLGYLRFRHTSEQPESVNLKPLGIWIGETFWSDGTEAELARTADEQFEMKVPGSGIVRFKWSLRGRSDSNRNTLFELVFPRGPLIELHLELPEDLVPRSSAGPVMEFSPEQVPSPPGFRRWRIPLGGNNISQLTIQPRVSSRTIQEKNGIHQRLTYDITPQGLDLSARFLFENIPSRTNEIIIELDGPIRLGSGPETNETEKSRSRSLIPLRVYQGTLYQQGRNACEWTLLPDSEKGTSRILVKLRDEPGNEARILNIDAQCPIPWGEPWGLPGMRIDAPNMFWTETSATVQLMSPLIARELRPVRARQTLPSISRTDREVFSFLYFDEQSHILIDLANDEPRFKWDSGTFVRWSRSEILGTQAADFSIPDGRTFFLELPLNPRWTIDSIESVPKGSIQNWEVVETPPSDSLLEPMNRLRVYLRWPLESERSLRLKFGARYTSTSEPDSVRHLVPIPSRTGNGTQHLLAIEPGSNYRLRFPPLSNHEEIPFEDAFAYSIRQYFSESPDSASTVIALNERTLDAHPVLEALNPSFTAEIRCDLGLRKNGYSQSYTFKCVPNQTRIERIIVRFSEQADTEWRWSLGSEGETALHSRRIPPAERRELGLQGEGDFWEIRPGTARSGSIVLSASRSGVLNAPKSLPLASLPEAASQHAEIVLDSPVATNIKIHNKGVRTLPERINERRHYQTVRSAFLYDPAEDIGSAESPLILLEPEDVKLVPQTPTAWVWSLELASMYEPNGIVRQRAVFHIENRGKDKINITLPVGVGGDDIHAVWVDDTQVPWHQEIDSASSDLADKTGRSLVSLFLPERERYTCVYIEYSTTETPLIDRRKLRPHFPEIDIPILSGNWLTWVPPDYHLFFPENSSGETTLRQVINRLFFPLRNDPEGGPHNPSKPMNPFSMGEWKRTVFTDQERSETLGAARRFLEALGQESILRERSANREGEDWDIENKIPATGLFVREPEVSWGELLGNNDFLLRAFEHPNPEIYIDRIGLNRLGLARSTIVPCPDVDDALARGSAILEQADLTILFLDKDKLILTSALVAAMHRNELDPLEGDRTWLISNGEILVSFHQVFREGGEDGTNRSWTPLEEWLGDAAKVTNPWARTRKATRFSSMVPGWTAHITKIGEADNGLYIVHLNSVSTFRWIAMFLVLTLTWRRPFSNLSFLFFLLCVFGVLALAVSPYYVGIANGAFFGTIASIFFAMVRTEPRPKRKSGGSPGRILGPTAIPEEKLRTMFPETPVMRVSREKSEQREK